MHDYDFAVLQLASPLTLDGITTAAIDLPDENEPIDAGVQVTVSGWGQTKIPFDSFQYLRAADVVIASQEKCSEMWNNKGIEITDQMVCAYAQNRSACFVGLISVQFIRSALIGFYVTG
jgi:trypsin